MLFCFVTSSRHADTRLVVTPRLDSISSVICIKKSHLNPYQLFSVIPNTTWLLMHHRSQDFLLVYLTDLSSLLQRNTQSCLCLAPSWIWTQVVGDWKTNTSLLKTISQYIYISINICMYMEWEGKIYNKYVQCNEIACMLTGNARTQAIHFDKNYLQIWTFSVGLGAEMEGDEVAVTRRGDGEITTLYWRCRHLQLD